MIEKIWKIFLKIPKDKHGHFEFSLLGTLALRRFGVPRKWTFIIVFSLGILKECYDKWFGKEKKWDWGDLLADLLGTTLGIILI